MITIDVERSGIARDTTKSGEIESGVYYPWFDILRILLAGSVLLYHDGTLHLPGNVGNFAVQVFFALSGWLIGAILIRSKPADLPRFYFYRATRIWIPYFLATTFVLGASAMHDHITQKWLEIVFYKLTFVYNIFGTPQLVQYAQKMPLQGTANHFWSINAEEQFYLVAPLLLVVLPPKYGRSIIVWTVLAFIAWALGTSGSISFGVLAAILVNRFGPFHLRTAMKLAIAVIGGVAAVAMLEGFDYQHLAPICAIAIVLLLATNGKPFPFGRFLGGISYPLYLNCWIGVFAVNYMFKHLDLRYSIAGHILSASLGLLIASALYLGVDRRIMTMRGQLFTPRRGKVLMVTGYALTLMGLCGGLIFYLQPR